MANSFESVWICLDEVFFGVEGWRFQVLKVQSQQASGQSQRLLLLSLSEHQISQLFKDQLHSSCVYQLVILCEVMSAEQLQQHQPHHNGGLHQFQLH